MREKISGVYVIQSADGRIYVGSSVDVEKRWIEHKSRLRNGKHDNQILSEIVAEFGVDSLHHRVLLRCTPENLREQEQAAIDRLKPTLNVLPTAERLRQEMLERSKDPDFCRRRDAAAAEANKKPIRCITTGQVFPSKNEAAQALGISVALITKQLRGLPTRTKLQWEYLNG